MTSVDRANIIVAGRNFVKKEYEAVYLAGRIAQDLDDAHERGASVERERLIGLMEEFIASLDRDPVFQVWRAVRCVECSVNPAERPPKLIARRIRVLTRRIAHLEERIAGGEKDGRDLSFDKQERSALRWAVDTLLEILGGETAVQP